MDQLV